MIKTFSSGAALLHLALSVYKYGTLNKKDLAACIIEKLQWNNEATTELEKMGTELVKTSKSGLLGWFVVILCAFAVYVVCLYFNVIFGYFSHFFILRGMVHDG